MRRRDDMVDCESKGKKKGEGGRGKWKKRRGKVERTQNIQVDDQTYCHAIK